MQSRIPTERNMPIEYEATITSQKRIGFPASNSWVKAFDAESDEEALDAVKDFENGDGTKIASLYRVEWVGSKKTFHPLEIKE